ncbi:MAG: DNA protecting protein DprA [Candidatus Moranbacteria bacterium RIFCSPHIGHO2_01_FULL_54_31]|nr:MAG: DNA protecting protein DprA [Candidatus Moranbacteria bacterium RIFCSPHIGHO2_01_FULL_54_31]
MHPTAILYALSLIPGIGHKTLRALMEHFGSPEAVWTADEPSLLAVAGLRPKTLAALVSGRTTIDPEREWDTITRQGIGILAYTDDAYPSLLKEIPDAPALLFVRGQYDWSPKPLIAIVGSRKFTSYGEQAAHRFATDLAAAGYVVVSGLAFGIDSIAHKAALEAGAETLAILGSGVDDASIAPQSHLPLGRAVMQAGALISEYRPGTKANEGTFPARDRIIAGMTLGTVVIEAPEKSGALITARLALDYNREVFAVPGSVFSPSSLGTNALIRSGAKIVTSVQDILEEFPLPEKPLARGENAASARTLSLAPEEKSILAALSHEPLHVDKIIKAARLETSSANSILALLEIKGLIRDVGGMHYIRM